MIDKDTVEKYIEALRALSEAFDVAAHAVYSFNSSKRKMEQRAIYEYRFAPKRSKN